jgi:hypothetical protein
MKLTIAIISAASLGLTCSAPADDHSALAGNGYRWVTIHGPYASTTEQGVKRLTDHRAGAAEAQILEDEKAYYLIPGTIVQVIKEDPANGMSQVQLGGFATSLWTYSRFLSKHPIRDIYGVIETPENSGISPSLTTPGIPVESKAGTRDNRNQ